jgi:Glycosyl hydrolase family 79, N-terminal domain
MKSIAFLLFLYCASAIAEQVPDSVTITIQSNSVAAPLPPDFLGLSMEPRGLPPDAQGNYFFSPTNKQFVTLFRNIGISHLRMGGTSVESPPTNPIPDTTAIDNLFAFVKAAGVKKVIYSLRLLETNSALRYDITNAALAKYIWDHDRANLDCFAIGNEPDVGKVYRQDCEITNIPTYLAKWRRFANAITNAVPEAKFAGPDAGSANVPWPMAFARHFENSGLISAVTEHFYVGGAGRDVPAAQGIDDMLSPQWLDTNQKLYERVTVPVMKMGLPFRFGEANDHYSGGVKDASDTFAGALWALDFAHWWAAHSIRGIDFHNTAWRVNDSITLDSATGELRLNPKGYGLKAFTLGSRGASESLALQNPGGLNLTAYAYYDAPNHFVTIINKEHGPGAREASVAIITPRKEKRAEIIFLTALNNDAAAKTGVTLGGAPINNHESWQGKWQRLDINVSDRCIVKIPPTSAAIVKIETK